MIQKRVRSLQKRWQCSLIIALLFISTVVNAKAERNNLKPSDFDPLTSLPWKKPGATLEGVLGAIFREPNIGIRYPVLGEYLRTISLGQLGRAFDMCIDLEGGQTPDYLIEFFLPIWAERDAHACWKRTRELFHLVGIEDGWLGYDSWSNRRITVRDLGAIRRSRFWIEQREVLTSFGLGVDASPLLKMERVRFMKGFTDLWFSTLPGLPEAWCRWLPG